MKGWLYINSYDGNIFVMRRSKPIDIREYCIKVFSAKELYTIVKQLASEHPDAILMGFGKEGIKLKDYSSRLARADFIHYRGKG
ncbi:hypothetical protein ES708_05019 [subsurface metagenome]